MTKYKEAEKYYQEVKSEYEQHGKSFESYKDTFKFATDFATHLLESVSELKEENKAMDEMIKFLKSNMEELIEDVEGDFNEKKSTGKYYGKWQDGYEYCINAIKTHLWPKTEESKNNN